MQTEWGTIVKSVNWTLVFNLINFAILLLLLRRLLFKPAMEYLDARRDLIAEQMASAAKSEEDARALVETKTDELETARARAADIVKDANARSTDMIDAAKGEARKEADRIVADARARMEQERDDMIGDLKSAYADIAILGAERVLDREIKIDDHQKLLDQLAAEIDEDALRVNP